MNPYPLDRSRRRATGMTLLEVLLVCAILGVVMVGIQGLVRTLILARTSTKPRIEERLVLLQVVRLLRDDIRSFPGSKVTASADGAKLDLGPVSLRQGRPTAQVSWSCVGHRIIRQAWSETGLSEQQTACQITGRAGLLQVPKEGLFLTITEADGTTGRNLLLWGEHW